MKKFLCGTMAAMMLFTSTAFADTTANVFIGDKLVNYTDQVPVIINDRTYVPIRDVFEAAGFEVNWNAETKTVTINNEYCQIMLFVPTNGMLTLDTKYDFEYETLENPIQIVNGRTLLPLREILESVNYKLDWDAETKSAYVKDENDYDELKASREKLEALFSKEQFKVDESKPKGELTKEEYAYLENFINILADVEKMDETMNFSDELDKMTPEQAVLLKKTINGYLSKLSDVECPESLEGMEDGLKELVDSLFDNFEEIAEATQANPDNQELSLMTGLSLIVSLAVKADNAFAPVDKICRERNIDLNSVFGDKLDGNITDSLF